MAFEYKVVKTVIDNHRINGEIRAMIISEK